MGFVLYNGTENAGILVKYKRHANDKQTDEPKSWF